MSALTGVKNSTVSLFWYNVIFPPLIPSLIVLLKSLWSKYNFRPLVFSDIHIDYVCSSSCLYVILCWTSHSDWSGCFPVGEIRHSSTSGTQGTHLVGRPISKDFLQLMRPWQMSITIAVFARIGRIPQVHVLSSMFPNIITTFAV